jgi:purine nucleosidase/pyrimidine-specific ribonucleoside hydrolase
MATLKRLVLMGGAVAVPGNITPAAEFNMFVDPHAASIVFRSGIPLTMVCLDVTRQVRLSKDALSEAIGSEKTPVGRFLLDCTANLFTIAVEREGEASFPLHDPLAIGAVIDPSFVGTEPMYVGIETMGELTEGMTVADRRPLKPEWKRPPNADVCVSVDASRFLSFLLERLLCLRSSL